MPDRSRHRVRAGRRWPRPAADTSASAGSVLPPWLATSTLPSATSEVAKSRITGNPPGRGMPMQTGAVENRRSTPPKGATSTEPATLTKCTDTSPYIRRHFGPFADPPDMPGMAQADRRKTVRAAFLDTDAQPPAVQWSGRSRTGRRESPAPAYRPRASRPDRRSAIRPASRRHSAARGRRRGCRGR